MEYNQSQQFPKLVKANCRNGPLMLSFSSNPSFPCIDQLDLHSEARDNPSFLQSPVSMNPSALQHSYEQSADTKLGASRPAISNIPLDWDPRAVLNNLSSLDLKLHQVQDVVRSMITNEGQLNVQDKELKAKEQLVTSDLHSILIQVISTAGTLLPLVNNTLASKNHFSSSELKKNVCSSSLPPNRASPLGETKLSDDVEAGQHLHSSGEKVLAKFLVDCEDGVDCENLPSGTFELLQLEEDEILTLQTHFCHICGKVFKRDANLRMHMRGHGDEYKSPAALAKPSREPNSEPVPIKRYSCPIVGCKRNKEHKKFLPLKTILCVKNHYKRSHCDKSYTCSRCKKKKFSMLADLKTHEKHCGSDKWVCSCGTTFSRKDKLFGHVSLFQGHAPLPRDESIVIESSLNHAKDGEPVLGTSCSSRLSFGGDNLDVDGFPDVGDIDDGRNFLSTYNSDSCDLGMLHEYPEPSFQVPHDLFPFMPNFTSSYTQEYGESSNHYQFG